MAKITQKSHKIFNAFDEIGLLVGLERLPWESNHDYRERLAEYRKNNPSSTKQGIVDAIASELGLSRYNALNKAFFVLEHFPSNSYDIKVYVDGVEDPNQLKEFSTTPEGWTVIPGTSGVYGDGTEGWIIWRDSEGRYTNLLEFTTAPTGAYVSVEYTHEVDGTAYSVTDKDETDTRRDPIYDLPGHWKCYSAATPEATGSPIVIALNDSDVINDSSNGYVDSRGLPTNYFREIVRYITGVSAIGWGYFVWDEAFYQEDIDSVETMPTLLDADATGFVRDGYNCDYSTGIDRGDSIYMISISASGSVELHPTGVIY